MPRWSEELSCRFVKLYKANEFLWNNLHPSYKSKRLRLQAFDLIAEELNIPDFTANNVAKKIKSLRSTYNIELAKIDRLRKSGDNEYKPTLKWFDDMDYIMKNSSIPITNTDAVELYVTLNDTDGGQEIYTEGDHNDTIDMADQTQTIAAAQQVRQRPSPKFRRISKASRGITSLSPNVSSSSPTIFVPANNPEDECDIIGKHVALQLKKLPVEDMVDANIEIQQILAKYRKKNFAAKVSVSSNQQLLSKD